MTPQTDTSGSAPVVLPPGALPLERARVRITIDSTVAGVTGYTAGSPDPAPGPGGTVYYGAELMAGGYAVEIPDSDELAGSALTRVRIEVDTQPAPTVVFDPVAARAWLEGHHEDCGLYAENDELVSGDEDNVFGKDSSDYLHRVVDLVTNASLANLFGPGIEVCWYLTSDGDGNPDGGLPVVTATDSAGQKRRYVGDWDANGEDAAPSTGETSWDAAVAVLGHVAAAAERAALQQ